MRRMRLAVESSNALVTRSVSFALPFTPPESTLSPGVASTGTLSPVSAALSMYELPSVITPSSGMRSYGLTTTVSPTATEAGETICSAPSRSTRAVSGRISVSAVMLRRERRSAISSARSPRLNRIATAAASPNSPRQNATMTAIDMSTFSVKFSLTRFFRPSRNTP